MPPQHHKTQFRRATEIERKQKKKRMRGGKEVTNEERKSTHEMSQTRRDRVTKSERKEERKSTRESVVIPSETAVWK